MPGNEPYYGATDAPLKYTLGRYDFEASSCFQRKFLIGSGVLGP